MARRPAQHPAATIRAGYEHALSALRHRHGARTTFAPGLRPAPCPDVAPRTQSSSASITMSPTECSRTCRGSIRMSTNGSPTMRSEPSCVQCGFLTPMPWRQKAEQLVRESISWIATTGVRLDEADLVLDLLCRWVFHRSAGWAVSSWSFRSCVAAQLASRASPSWEALSGSGL